jgi:hypothetical protein
VAPFAFGDREHLVASDEQELRIGVDEPAASQGHAIRSTFAFSRVNHFMPPPSAFICMPLFQPTIDPAF